MSKVLELIDKVKSYNSEMARLNHQIFPAERIWFLSVNPYFHKKSGNDFFTIDNMKRLLCDDQRYNNYAISLSKRTYIPARIESFVKCYKQLDTKDSAQYFSVLAFAYAKEQTMRKIIDITFEKYYEESCGFERHPYNKLNNLNYILSIEEMGYYQKALCLLLASQKNEEIRRILTKTLILKHEELDGYCNIFISKIKDNECKYVDGSITPFIDAYISSVGLQINEDVIIAEIVFINEIFKLFDIKFHEDIISTLTSIFFNLSWNKNKITKKCEGKKIISYTDQLIKEKDTFVIVKSFLELLSELNRCQPYIKNTSYADNIFDYFYDRSAKELEQLLNEYLSSQTIRLAYFNQYNMDISNTTELMMEAVEAVVSSYINVCIEENPHKLNGRERDVTSQSILLLTGFTEYVSRTIEKRENMKNYSGICQKKENLKDESKILKEKDSRIKQLEGLLKNEENVQKRIKNSEAEISNLQKQIRELKEEIEENKKDKKELVSLRNYVYETENSDNTNKIVTKTAVDVNEMADFLNQNIRGIIIGGHSNLQNKLASVLGDWKIYKVQHIVPENTIANSDIVVMFTDHLDHASYNCAIKQIRNSNSKLLYIHNVNIEYVINRIYEESKEVC